MDALWNFEIPAHICLDMHHNVINSNLSLVPKHALVTLSVRVCYLILQTTGIVMEGAKRIQLNIAVEPIHNIP